MKFIRDFEIQIKTPPKSFPGVYGGGAVTQSAGSELITIKPPFSMDFNCTRNVLSSVNNCTLTLYNLGAETRNKLFKDAYATAEYWQMIVKGGYDRLSVIFQGNIREASSYKDGPNWITAITSTDGGYAIQNGDVNITVQADTPKKNIIEQVWNSFPETLAGIIGGMGTEKSPRGQVITGKAGEALDQITSGNYMIDMESVHAIDLDEVLPGPVILLDSEQLLATPKRRETFLDCEILFLPEAKVGILAEIRSKETIYNGQYKVLGFTHNLSIRGDQCGNARTTMSLYCGAKGLKQL